MTHEGGAGRPWTGGTAGGVANFWRSGAGAWLIVTSATSYLTGYTATIAYLTIKHKKDPNSSIFF